LESIIIESLVNKNSNNLTKLKNSNLKILKLNLEEIKKKK
jgi:hypothetical protein